MEDNLRCFVVIGNKGKYDRRIIYAVDEMIACDVAKGSFNMTVVSIRELKKETT